MLEWLEIASEAVQKNESFEHCFYECKFTEPLCKSLKVLKMALQYGLVISYLGVFPKKNEAHI